MATVQQEEKRHVCQTRIQFLDQVAKAEPLIGDRSNERDRYRDREMQARDPGSYGTELDKSESNTHCAETEETRTERKYVCARTIRKYVTC
jgi:hypothetical protein